MAVLNPPRVIPGLGRSIVNFLIENRSSWDEAGLIEAFKPLGVNEGDAAPDGVTNTLSALRAIRLLQSDKQGNVNVTESVTKSGSSFTRTSFRRVLVAHVLDLDRDGDPWSATGEQAATSGARDLTRALSWFLAQDALGAPLRWVDSVEKLQFQQFATDENHKWALPNNTRWPAFARWAPALGLAVPSVVRGKPGLIPLPTVAIADALDEMPDDRMPIDEFLSALALKLPVLSGGVIRNSLVARLGLDPDPGVQAHAVDSSVAQVLKLLEARGRLVFENMADAAGVRLSRFDGGRTTHVTLKGGNKN